MSERFEDLLRDLKESDLLERTVVDSSAVDQLPLQDVPPESGYVVIDSLQDELDFIGGGSEARELPALDLPCTPVQPESRPEVVSEDGASPRHSDSGIYTAAVRSRMKKRAVELVNALQTVDHVLSGVEREQKKTVSEPRDGLHIKQALHDLVQALESHDAGPIPAAESHFESEAEKWTAELVAKDSRILPAELRRYCETARPVLSGRALTELQLFYVASPFSNSTREKFEVVVTRLYSRDTGPDRRRMLFGRDLIAQQIAVTHESRHLTRFGESANGTVEGLVKNLDMLAKEAEFADSFADLVGDDFLKRFRVAKESIGNDAFAPAVAAALIDVNIFIGNRFSELLEQEKRKSVPADFTARFAFVCDENVSKLVGQTMTSEERLCRAVSRTAPRQSSIDAERRRRSRAGLIKRLRTMFTISPWLFAVLLVVVLSAVAIYFGTKRMILETDDTSMVKKVNLEKSSFRQFMTGATITGDTFTATVTPEWAILDPAQKEDVIRKLLDTGMEKGFRYVRLTDFAGKTTAVGRPEGIELKE